MAEGTQHPITDPGRRLSEAVSAARQQGGAGRWIAVTLAEGKWNQEIYDSREDAVRHNDEARHALLMVPPMPMPPAEATAWIDLQRRVWESGFRFTNPGEAMPIPDLGPTATAPKPGRRPSGLIVPSGTVRRPRRR